MPEQIATTTLATRIPGHAVIDELLRSHEATSPRGPLARLFGVRPLSVDERSWYSGALGERAVGRMLAALDDSWTVLHGVPVGSGTSDIDHVVLGPGGVFTINTKHHPGQRVWVASRAFLVAGHKHPYLRNSEHEAERATKKLSSVLPGGLAVVPVIAIVDAQSITIRERPATVVVLNARSLLRWLRTRPVVLDAGQIASVVAVAVQPATWHSAPTTSTDPGTVLQRFEALHREVSQARTRRLGWAGVLFVGFIAGLLASGPLAALMIALLFGA